MLSNKENQIAIRILTTLGIEAAEFLSANSELIHGDATDSAGHLNAYKEAEANAFEVVTRREYGASMSDSDDEMMDRVRDAIIANKFRLAHFTYAKQHQVPAA